jgi:hypothetical protein
LPTTCKRNFGLENPPNYSAIYKKILGTNARSKTFMRGTKLKLKQFKEENISNDNLFHKNALSDFCPFYTCSMIKICIISLFSALIFNLLSRLCGQNLGHSAPCGSSLAHNY